MGVFDASASLSYLAESFANVFNLSVDAGVPEDKNVEKVIAQTSLVCAVLIFIQPFPLADFLVLTPILAKMTLHIGKAKGFEISQERALEIVREVFGIIGLAWAATAVVASLAKMIPFVGGLLLVPLAYGAVWAIGKVVDAYFDGMRTGTIPRAEEMKELFRREFSEGKARGAALRKEELESLARDLKRRIAEREAAKAAGAAGGAPAPAQAGDGISVKVTERAVRQPKPELDAPAPPAEAKKTIGPEERSGPDVRVRPAEPKGAKKTIGPDGYDVRDTAPPPPESAPAPAPTAAAPAPAPVAKGADLVNELERLAKLKEMGALTPEEFDAAKKRLLA